MNIKKLGIFIGITVIALIVHLFLTSIFGDSFDSRNRVITVDSRADERAELTAEESLGKSLGAMNGSTPSALIKQLGERYSIAETEFEYSGEYRGNIIRTEILSDIPDESGKIPVKVTLSKGSALTEEGKADFKNLIDPQEWFDGSRREYYDGGMGFTVSYNEFLTAGGLKCRVRFYSTGFEFDEEGNIVYSGGQYMAVQMGEHGEVHTFPCGKEEVSTANAYKYTERFALELEDYNGDGTPDFCFRVGEPTPLGAYYCMLLTNADGEPEYRRHSGGGGDDSLGADNFFVKMEDAPSIRLDIIDRDTYFFLSQNKSDNYKLFAAVYNMRTGAWMQQDKYLNNGLIFSSRYEDGCICLKATDIDSGNADLTAALSLKRLKDMCWEDMPLQQTEAEFHQIKMIPAEEILIPADLEKGVYKIEVKIKDRKTCTEFYVR